MAQNKREKRLAGIARRAASKKGEYMSKHNLIPEQFEHKIEPGKANRAERRAIQKQQRKKKG